MFLKLIAARIEQIGYWLLFPAVVYSALSENMSTGLVFTYTFLGAYIVKHIINKEYYWLLWQIFCLIANLIVFLNPLKQFFHW